MGNTTPLSQSNKHGLDEDVSEDWDDEVIRSGLELDIEEAPLVERDRVGVQDVGWVLVHGNGALGNPDDLGRRPAENADHSDQGEDGQNDLTSRVALCKLPEAQDHHLGETDEDDTEQNALEHSSPAVAEVNKLVALHLACLDETFTDELEGNDADNHKDDENDEEAVAREEDVGRLDASAEADTLDAVEDNAFIGPDVVHA